MKMPSARTQLFHFSTTQSMASEEMAERLLAELRADVLREAADRATAKYGATNRAAADLRRMADGSQP
ncbi:hypothetical protein [Streptomyces sp. NPDC058758]|uniref:hypothetical protein n=1 Tax=Streptomyces sp. NPDC058758 TaxID=3346627 RepID=UPI0036A50802